MTMAQSRTTARCLPRLSLVVWTGGAVVLWAALSMVWSQGDPKLPATHLLSLVATFAAGWFWPQHERDVGAAYLSLTALAWLLWMFSGVLNPNFIGCLVAFGIAIAVAQERWFSLLLLGPALYLTGSRGAIIAAGLIALVRLWRWSKVTSAGVALIVVLLALSHRSLGESLLNRMGVWQDTLNHLTFWGSGWGSFADAYASWPVHTNMTLALAPHAYNDVLELLFELGVGAGLLWLFLAAVLTHGSSRAGLILFGFAACSLTYFPLWLLLLPQTLAYFLGVGASPKGHSHD